MNEAALKARLKSIAQEKLKTFNEIWKQLLLERFLARLSGSTYREQFIFDEINSWLTNLQKTIEAMREAERGQLKSFKTVQSLMNDLNNAND